MRRSSGFPRLGQSAIYPTLVVAASVAAGLSLPRTAVPFLLHSVSFPVSFEELTTAYCRERARIIRHQQAEVRHRSSEKVYEAEVYQLKLLRS